MARQDVVWVLGAPDAEMAVIQGVPSGSDIVRRFVSGEVVPGLTDYYGDPARGFAGGYITQSGD